MISRRLFLERVGATAALGVLAQLSPRQLRALTPSELLPEPDEAWLRELALRAIDSARSAGATFADIRLVAARHLVFGCEYIARPGGVPTMGPPDVGVSFQYGVRALIDGAWGFVGGTDLTPDGVGQAARTAVEVARANRPRRPRTFTLAPTPPVANGVWATPLEQDPLRVPIGEQGDLALAALADAARFPQITSGLILFEWRRPTTVFASTEGSLILQRLATALPSAGVRARVGQDIWSDVEAGVDLNTGGYGYEVVRGVPLGAKMREAAERAVSLAKAARAAAPVEVGRYDLVLGANVVGALLASVASALDLELALGYRQTDEGSSFAAPPVAALGRMQMGSKLLTVHADRSLPHGAATVGWDAEGVKPESYTFLQDGTVVDYHTNRETATHLADWYTQRGEPVRSHGCACRVGDQRPVVRVPNLTLEPASGTTSVDDLIAATTQGLYVEGLGLGAPDQQLLSAQYSVAPTQVREIRRGKLGQYIKDVGIHFITPQFWAGLDALGGPESVRSVVVGSDPEAAFSFDQPFPFSTVRAVPARVRQVNVVNLGRTA